MAQFASDTFAGTSGTELSAYSASWTRHTAASTTGINTVISDAARARGSANGGSSVYTHSGSPAGANYSVSGDLVFKEANGGDGFTGVIGRADTTAATFYMFRYAGSTTDGWQLYVSNGGSFTQLGTTATATVADEATKAIELRMVSDQISGYVAGVLTIGPETNAVISAAGKSGTRIGSSESNILGIHLDNFSADDVTGVTESDASSTGTGTATGVSGATAGSVGASDGVGAAAGVAAGVFASVGSSTGTSTASADAEDAAGATIIEATAEASGTGTATGVSGSTSGAVAESAGIADASGVSGATVGTVGAASGTASVNGVGADGAIAEVVVTDTHDGGGWLQPVKRHKQSKEVRKELERLFRKAEVVVEKIAEDKPAKQPVKEAKRETNTVDIGLPPLTELQMVLMHLRMIQDEMTGQQVVRLAEIQQELDRARMYNIRARAALLAA